MTTKDTGSKPADEVRFQRARITLQKQSIVYDAVPWMFMIECWSAVRSYHGSSPRAILYLTRYAFEMWCWWHWTGLLCWISDRVGWTKLYKFPATEEIIAHKQRHGWKCSGSPNCENINCISDSLPRWFKKFSGRHEEGDE